VDAADTEAFYRAYNASRPADRQHPLNREVLLQRAANEIALFRVLGAINFDKDQTVLDVGGGGGGTLVPFVGIGCPALTLTCLDIRDGSAELAQRLPGVPFHHCDAQKMPFPDRHFDLVCAFTMFHQLRDDVAAPRIAAEMRRVCRGHIVIADWAMAHKGDQAVTLSYVERIFGLKVTHTERGALAPPLGRRLSRISDAAYFAVRALFPIAAAGRVYAMKV